MVHAPLRFGEGWPKVGVRFEAAMGEIDSGDVLT